MVSRLCDMTSDSVNSSSEIRQQFLDFFQSKQHTIVPSSSLMPDAPNLLFTNAGMNQFVPIFLDQQKSPYTPGRAADTQKCIRAGGKHNDLEDVGLDTYHHTFFEMLGNWSFGDYFKKEAIDWAWELITEVWKFPKERLYATVYRPDKEAGDPADFDQEAYNFWEEKFVAAGLDPKVHIVNGNKKDNFWMMGETGPCGPCSELHMDLTPEGDTKGSLVNADSAQCIEIWNLVFIQFNANQDGTYSNLPATHVDTGMGFERVAAIMQCSEGFTDFSKTVSNYDTDIFAPIFAKLSEISGKSYTSTVPKSGSSGDTEQEKVDIAFRVIADHIRTLSFSIADGIVPGNNDRNYVLKRILRRAVRYGRTLGVERIFFCDLVDVLVAKMGGVFPELKERRDFIVKTIRTEEEAFNKTLDRGIDLFNGEAGKQKEAGATQLEGDFAFKLYDTYGFPLDLTELMAREMGLSVDTARFDVLMEEQRDRARKARKSEIIEVTDLGDLPATEFNGFENLSITAEVKEVVSISGKTAFVLDTSPFYAEMGGQSGDTGIISLGDQTWNVSNTIKSKDTFLHMIKGDGELPE
ncbi:alanine--tRNA ligase, partial [Verrucomicrobia bacterium]|nr:alanine--tRNA ligase [Verrucomicrobiota bacterium]